MDFRIINLRLWTDGIRLIVTGQGCSTVLSTRLAMPINRVDYLVDEITLANKHASRTFWCSSTQH